MAGEGAAAPAAATTAAGATSASRPADCHRRRAVAPGASGFSAGHREAEAAVAVAMIGSGGREGEIEEGGGGEAVGRGVGFRG